MVSFSRGTMRTKHAPKGTVGSFDWRCPPDDMPKGGEQSHLLSGPVEGWLSFSKVEETRSWQMLAPGCVTRLWRDSSRRMWDQNGPGREWQP